MTAITKKICSVFILISLVTISCKLREDVYDGFEAPGLNKIWASDRMVNGSFEVQSHIVRTGHSAAKITLKTGDIFEAGVGKNKDSERDELREADKLVSVEGKKYAYRFSLFLPDTFPVVPVRLVIAQWKQDCGGDSSCSDDSPVMAIRYIGGKLHVTIQTDTEKKTVYETYEEVRGKWLDFRFEIIFSRLGNGLVNAWLNDKQIINFKGATCYSSKKGYPGKSHFYFKMGLYRDVMPEPMTIYIDEYEKKELTE